MTRDSRWARRGAVGGFVALGAFWLLVFAAGRLEPGYRPTRDYVSALASEGARFPALGVLALVTFGIAYLAAAVVLQTWVGTRFGALLMAGAGAITWIVALARIHCPGGAANCGHAGTNGVLVARTAGSTLGPHVHGWAVALSYALVAVAMLWLAVLWRRRHHPLRASASGAALIGSLATVPFWVSSDAPGLAQRLWLGILSAWVALVCVRPLVDLDAAQPEEAA